MVTDFVNFFWTLLSEWTATAVAVAEEPLLLEVTVLIFHAEEGHVVLWEEEVHLDVRPLYVNVALIDTDQSVKPFLLLYFEVFVFVMDFDEER